MVRRRSNPADWSFLGPLGNALKVCETCVLPVREDGVGRRGEGKRREGRRRLGTRSAPLSEPFLVCLFLFCDELHSLVSRFQ